MRESARTSTTKFMFCFEILSAFKPFKIHFLVNSGFCPGKMSSMFDDSDTDNPPVYKKGDIVWVKLSSYWWPGEVKNEEDLPSDLIKDFKKPPLVIVKFFEEDT